MQNKPKKQALVMIGAKIPIEIKKAIEKQAEMEERSVSQVVSRLLASHPALAPAGHARWTLRLLADKAVSMGFVDSISHNAVKEILKKTDFDRT